MPIEKEEDLFKLSNAALKERLTQEGIAFETDDNKKTLVARLNGDFKPSQSDDAAAEKAALEGAAKPDAQVEITTAQAVADKAAIEAGAKEGEPEQLIGLEGIDGDEIDLIDDNKIKVDEVVKGAFKRSGLSVAEWNKLEDIERWRFATPFLDEKQKELYEACAAREDAATAAAAVAAANNVAAGSEAPEPENTAGPVDTAGAMGEPEETQSEVINRLELEKGSLQAIVNNQSEQITKLTSLVEDGNKLTAKLTQDLADAQLNIDRAATLHGHIDDLPKL